MSLRQTVSDALLESLQRAGVRFLFGNLGTDHPTFVETLAKYRQGGEPLPEMILCAHENTAITAAHGAALATGQGQGVFVHVGVGTQNLGGALHNAWAGRVPMFIFAGRAPLDARGVLRGGRDTPIHYHQDVRDQAGILRQYCKWEFNLELPEQATFAFQRGLRLMQSEPRGAVYLTAAREVLDQPLGEIPIDPPGVTALPLLGGLPPEAAEAVAQALHEAERPLIVTTYAGRNPAAVAALVELCETAGVPVIEAMASHLNFPRDHELYWGVRAQPAIEEADLILLIDTDVPWLARHGVPAADARIVQVDVDPLKPHMNIWDYPVSESYWADSARALPDITRALRGLPARGEAAETARREWLGRHSAPPWPATEGPLTAGSLSALLGELLPETAVVFDEGITSRDPIQLHTGRRRPGTYFGTPGSSLGWGGGAALGHKLACPDPDAVWLVGDGSYVFSVPSSLYLTAQKYRVPFLTVIYNNGGWNAVKIATQQVFGGEGHAAGSGAYLHDFGDGARLEQVAAAFGCHVGRATTGAEFEQAFVAAREAMRAGRAAVINALLSPQ